jgi:hypothetical protein
VPRRGAVPPRQIVGSFSVQAALTANRHLASSGRPGLPGRARGTGPPNPVPRQPDSDPPRTGAGDPLPDAHARLGVKPHRASPCHGRPGTDSPEPDSSPRRR